MTVVESRPRALLVSSDDDPLDAAERALLDAAFDVHRCHAPGSPSPLCTGIVTGECPLDVAGGIDVLVDVRQHPWPLPTRHEIGVTCALRAGVPVVVVGRAPHPFSDRAAATVDGIEGLGRVCEDAMSDALDAGRAAVQEAVGAVLELHGHADAPMSARLERKGEALRVRIAVDVARAVGSRAAARAAVAARRFDPRASKIEIEVVEPAAQR
jgi:hypothetical protein